MKVSLKFLVPLFIDQADATKTKRRQGIIAWVRDGAHLTSYVGDMVKRRTPEKSRAWRVASYVDAIFTLVALGAVAAQIRIWLGKSLGEKKAKRRVTDKISPAMVASIARRAGYTGPIAPFK